MDLDIKDSPSESEDKTEEDEDEEEEEETSGEKVENVKLFVFNSGEQKYMDEIFRG